MRKKSKTDLILKKLLTAIRRRRRRPKRQRQHRYARYYSQLALPYLFTLK